MAGSEIVVLGGGFGGAAAALAARRLLPPEHRITLIDRSPTARLCGSNPLVAVGERPEDGTIRSIDALNGEGVEVAVADIAAIDLDAGEVATSGGRRRFDQLVVALGAGYDWDAVPGSADAGTFYDHDGAVRLRRRLEGFDGGTVAVVVAGMPVKCPPASIEMILLIEEWARRCGIRHRVDLHVAIPEPAPLAVAGPDAPPRISAILADRGVTLHTAAKLAEVAGGTEARFADGRSIAADVLAVVPVHRAPPVVSASGLTGGGPWVQVDPATLETAVPGVFAIGDVNRVPVGEIALPKAGVFAADQGRTVAAVLAARLLGDEPPPPYTGEGHCHLAVSTTEAAALGGVFLGPGGPDVGLGPVDAATAATAARWEADWEAYRV